MTWRAPRDRKFEAHSAPAPILTARHHSICRVCGQAIEPGERIQIRGWEQRIPVHADCAPAWNGAIHARVAR